MEDLARITAEDYASDLPGRSLEQLRQMRSEAEQYENGLSFVRRVLQGRLDILGGELSLRRSGADPTDMGEIIERMPATLAEHSRSAGLPRPPQDMAPAELTDSLIEGLSDRHNIGVLGSLPDMTEEELESAVGGLTAAESEVSGSRRQLHGVIDVLQAEIIRRYKAGEASVESLLT